MLRELEYLTWARKVYEKPDPGTTDLATSGTPWVVPEELGLHVNHVADLHAPERFRDALAKRFGTKPKNVAVALGTSCAIYTVFRAIVKPGEVVAVESPAYEPLVKVPEAAGATVARFERTAASGFAIDPAAVMRALGPTGRIAIVSDLHNPTGMVADRGALRELSQRLAARDGFLIVDEAYRDFMIPRDGLVTARTLGPNVIAIASFTKVYGLAWARAGWILGPSRVCTAAEEVGYYVAGRYGYGYGAAGCVAIEKIDWLLERSLKLAEGKIDKADAFINSRRELTWHRPPAGIFGFPMIADGRAVSSLVEGPATARKLILNDGKFFGFPAGMRLGLAAPHDQFDAGINTLALALDDWSALPHD
ncbi:MAG: pyridoxal phosphate-dependent aminotransferase [Planctomycetota bacterium]